MIYLDKLADLNITDPYTVLQAVFTALTNSNLSDLQYPDDNFRKEFSNIIYWIWSTKVTLGGYQYLLLKVY